MRSLSLGILRLFVLQRKIKADLSPALVTVLSVRGQTQLCTADMTCLTVWSSSTKVLTNLMEACKQLFRGLPSSFKRETITMFEKQDRTRWITSWKPPKYANYFLVPRRQLSAMQNDYKNEENQTRANWWLCCSNFLHMWALQAEKDNFFSSDNRVEPQSNNILFCNKRTNSSLLWMSQMGKTLNPV